MRETGPRAGPLHERTRAALGRLPAGREGDRDAQPPRLLAAPELRLLRRGGQLSRHCDVSLVLHRGGGRLGSAATTAATPSRCRRECPSCGSVSIVRHGAGTERIEELVEELVAPAAVFRLDADSASGRDGHTRGPRGLRSGRRRRARRHPDGRQGPRLRRRRPQRAARRRLDPALPRLPRRGADLLARRPARRPQRPRRAGRARADPDPRPRRDPDRRRRRARRPRLPRRGARAPARVRLPAVLLAGRDRARRRRRGRAGRGRRSARRRDQPRRSLPAPSCSGRRRASGGATASAAGS